MSYLRYLCLFTYSDVQHTLCCVFVLFVFVLCTLCCQFHWIVHFRVSLRYRLTFILKMATLFYFISIPTVSFECFLGGFRILLCFSSFIYCLFQSRKVSSHISTCVRDIDFVSVTRYNDFSVSFSNYSDSVVICVSPLVVRYNV